VVLEGMGSFLSARYPCREGGAGGARRSVGARLQGYLTHKKRPPPYRTTIGPLA